MQRFFSALAITLFAATLAAASAHAKEKAKNAVAANAVAVECFKQFGFSYDATTKKWTLFTADDSIGKMDAVKACISRGTGIPVTQIPLREVCRVTRQTIALRHLSPVTGLITTEKYEVSAPAAGD